MLDFPHNRHAVAMIGADYTEYQPETMRGYSVALGSASPGPERFKTLDDAMAFAAVRAEKIFTLSSVDNYASDVRSASK